MAFAAHRPGGLATLGMFASTCYYATVRDLRRGHANALVAILSEMLQAIILLVVILAFLNVLNIGQMILRGNAVLSILTGIFLFLIHTRTVTKVSGAATNAALFRHAPASPLAFYVGTALSGLYIHILSLLLVGVLAHVFFAPIEIDNVARTVGCVLLAWLCGLGVGVLAAAVRLAAPKFVQIATSFYARGNMVFSGKMVLAGGLSAAVLNYFLWNPLFHIIDQARGAIFINYTATTTNLIYPAVFGATCFLLGLMIEHRLRR